MQMLFTIPQSSYATLGIKEGYKKSMDTYNCPDASNSAYGAGGYGTCTTSVGAPNTGFFAPLTDGGSFTIVAPLAAEVLLVVIALVLMARRKHKKSSSSDKA